MRLPALHPDAPAHPLCVPIPRGLRDLYAQSDAFVLPTRGEGWGLPIAEAMSMGLPSIATNFSGPSAFLTAENAHPLPVARHLPDGSAEPSVPDLGRAMRRCLLEHQTPAGRARSERARSDMQSKFSRAAVAQVVIERLHALAARRRRLERKKAAGGAASSTDAEEAGAREEGAGADDSAAAPPKGELRVLEEERKGRGRGRGSKKEL